MTLRERIDAKIADFNGRHPEWDTTIIAYTLEGSKRGKGPGMSVYVWTVDMGFEIPLAPGDDVVATLGMTIECEVLEPLARRLAEERAAGRRRMQDLGLADAEIEAALRYAEKMHAGQLASIERDLLISGGDASLH